jgi:UDP-N-acetylmuramoylalanine--D-glutamate ligase
MKIAIIGFGKEGKSALEFLRRQKEYKIAEFWVLDKKPNADIPKDVFARSGDEYLKHLDRFDLIVRSPGIRYGLPEIQATIKKGITVTSPTKIFFENCPTKNIIGVTGTKGKGTTSTLIYKILAHSQVLKNMRMMDTLRRYPSVDTFARCPKESRRGIFLAGNIGVPVLSILPKLNKDSWIVLEMSSFQLIDLKESPHIAIVLMTTSEHLDWHGSVKEYRNAKANIVRFQKPNDFAVLAADYPASRGYAKLARAKTFFFSRQAKMPFAGAGLQGTFVQNGAFWFSDGKKKERICATSDLQIPGEHNWENVGAAITVARILKIPKAVIVKTLREFKGLEHRLEFVIEKKGVRYYNDSYATTPETTIAAIRAFPDQSKILILGGSSKNSNFRELGKVISKSKSIKAIVGIGIEWKRIKERLGSVIPAKAEIQGEDKGSMDPGLRRDDEFDGTYKNIKIIEGCKNMKEIMSAVKKIAASGDVVLLSPACASFGMFKNYSERGEQFKYWAKEQDFYKFESNHGKKEFQNSKHELKKGNIA